MDVAIQKCFILLKSVILLISFWILVQRVVSQQCCPTEAEDPGGDCRNQGHTFACLVQRHTFLVGRVLLYYVEPSFAAVVPFEGRPIPGPIPDLGRWRWDLLLWLYNNQHSIIVFFLICHLSALPITCHLPVSIHPLLYHQTLYSYHCHCHQHCHHLALSCMWVFDFWLFSNKK